MAFLALTLCWTFRVVPLKDIFIKSAEEMQPNFNKKGDLNISIRDKVKVPGLGNWAKVMKEI